MRCLIRRSADEERPAPLPALSHVPTSPSFAHKQRFAALGLDNRTQVFDIEVVRESEFLRRAKAAARRRSLTFEWVPERGVGSHGTLYFGKRFTIVKDLKKEIGPGLLAAMCKQLGIRTEDI